MTAITEIDEVRTDDHVHPFNFAEVRSVLDDVFVGCQQNLKIVVP